MEHQLCVQLMWTSLNALTYENFHKSFHKMSKWTSLNALLFYKICVKLMWYMDPIYFRCQKVIGVVHHIIVPTWYGGFMEFLLIYILKHYF